MKKAVSKPRMNPRSIALAAVAVIISISAVFIPWQVKTGYLLDFDAPQSSAFTAEQPKAIKYNPIMINLPGAGASGRNDYQLEFEVRGAVQEQGGLQPQMSVTVNGMQLDTFQLQVGKLKKAYILTDTVGNLNIEFKILRDENVKLRYAKLYYIKITPSYTGGIQLPPIDLLLKLSASILVGFAIPLIFKCRRRTGFVILIFFSAFVSFVLASSRLHITIMADDLFTISIIMLALSFAVSAAMKYIFKFDFSIHKESKFIKGFLIAIIFFLGFKLLFVVHPSLISLDIGYHTRNLKKVLSGDLNLITVYPGDIYKIPYPPLFYMFVVPFTVFTAKFKLLLKIIFGVIEIISPVLLGLIARKLFGGMKYAFWAFITYNLIPFSYRCVSAGFIAEQFSQLLFLALTLIILSIKEYKLKHFVLLFLITFALLMSHFGIVIKFYISVLAMLLLVKLLEKGGIPVRTVIVIVILATVATYLVFYIHYNEMLWDGVKKVLSNKSPIPEGMQKPLVQNFTSQINYFGKYFFLPSLLSALGIILFLKRARGADSLNLEIKPGTNAKKDSKRTKTTDEPAGLGMKNTAIAIWILLTYLLIFLTWWLTPLKVRHFNFSLIVVALFAAYFLGNIPLNLKRYRAYLAFGLFFQVFYLFVILNRLIFYFYRAYIN